MAEPVTLNFKERRQPLIELDLPEGVFEIDPNLEVEDMGEGAVAEESVKRAYDTLDTLDFRDKVAVKAAKAEAKTAAMIASDFILYLVKKRQPKAKKLNLTGPETLEVLQVISGNEDGFEGEVLQALTAMIQNSAGDITAAAEAAQAETGQEGEQTAPLPSKKRSRSRSSSSAKRTAGRPDTTSGSPGESSGRTSPTPEPAAA